MSSLEEIREARLKKRDEFLGFHISPYPLDGGAFEALSSVRQKFSTLQKSKKRLRVVGRLMAFREHGKSFFGDLYDGSGRIQIFGKQDEMSKESFGRFMGLVDIGDFIEVRGSPFLTKKKEKSILIENWGMLAKSIRPLPEKWHGLMDTEERFRKRSLDLVMNVEARERFLTRSQIILYLRNFLSQEGFIEVETPLLHPVAGGALARPFVTHHDALNHDFYLRVAPELYLKRLLIGGMNKVFELGRNFRNEGIDMTHNPEFSMLELYEAYANASSHMDFLEKLFKKLIKEILKGTSFSYADAEISFLKKCERMTFSGALKRYALIPEYEKVSVNELRLRARQLGVDGTDTKGKGKIADEIFKKICRPKIIQPTFIIELPLDISPLAKSLEKKEGIADRYLFVIGGLEIANGFSELNDPVIQRERFQSQEEARAAGDAEVTRMDEDFLEALEYGMPPAGGWAIGIDRLVMLLTGQTNIREAVLFPTLRPR
ncbi:MAG: lysine--tRNA ligase [Candidatus Niyogibacteria bacterium]|nr:lysine--tRNA ligase [Candidatus Niyogibacteria bacterium]